MLADLGLYTSNQLLHIKLQVKTCCLIFFFFLFKCQFHLKLVGSLQKGLYTLQPHSYKYHQKCPLNQNHCLVSHKLFQASGRRRRGGGGAVLWVGDERGVLGLSLLHSSFLQVVSTMAFWSVLAQTVSEVFLHLCSAILWDSCNVCMACQSPLTLDVLYHTMPHMPCRFEVSDMHSLQCCV